MYSVQIQDQNDVIPKLSVKLTEVENEKIEVFGQEKMSLKDMEIETSSESGKISSRTPRDLDADFDDVYRGYFYFKNNALFKSRKVGKDGRYWFEIDPTNDIICYFDNETSKGGKQVGSFTVDSVAISNKKKKFYLQVKTMQGKKYDMMSYSKSDRDKVYDIIQKSIELNGNADELLEQWNSNQTLKMCLDPSLCFDEDFEPDLPNDEDLDIWELEVLDYKSNPVNIREIVSEKTTLILCLRHFGCLMCRMLCGRILNRVNDFQKLGVQIVAIGTGSPEAAEAFRKEVDFPGIVFVDPERLVYRTLGLTSMKNALAITRKSFAQIKAAKSEGYPTKAYNKSFGSLKQLGGCLCLHPDFGTIFQHSESYFGDVANLDDLIGAITQFCEAFPDQNWTTTRITKDWADLVCDYNSFCLPVVHENSGLNYELGCPASEFIPSYTLTNYTKYYADFLMLLDVDVYYTLSSPDGNPAVIVTEKSLIDKRILIFTEIGIYRLSVPSYTHNSEKEFLQWVTKKQWSDVPDINVVWMRGDHSKFRNTLEYVEQSVINHRYRIGVLFAPVGNTGEDDIYAVDYITEDFKEFIDTLGRKIQLFNWDKYDGDLDTKLGQTGEYAYYNNIGDAQIMYHVGPLIPKINNEPTTKRYVGNDVVVVIFKENKDAVVDISGFSSNVNQVFFVVEKDETFEETAYKIQVVSKQSVNSFPPYLPVNPVFTKTEGFSIYMLIKIINASQSATGSSRAIGKLLHRTRNEILTSFLSEVKKGKKIKISASNP